VYALAWVGLVIVFGLVTVLLLGLFDAPELAGIAALPSGLMCSTVFHVLLIFSFNDSFGQTAIDELPRA
jgi:hypothetical protein